jgi:sortase A
MTRHSVLQWIERGLLAAGVGLAAWCAAVLVEARFHQSAAAFAPLVVTQKVILPGEGGGSNAHALPSTTSAGALLGRLDAPSVRMSTVVLEGSDDATLSRGAGHIEDTPLPGQPGNIGIAGHRDTVFRPLRNIHVGEPLDLTTADRVYRYRVSKTVIVGPDDVYVLDPTQQPTLTLVTCYPFEFVGHAPRRFIVQAQLVGEERRTEAAPQSSGGSRGPVGSRASGGSGRPGR